MEPVRYAMIGGGEGAFIGPVHRTAAAIAGNCRLVAGALSSDPEKARRSTEAMLSMTKFDIEALRKAYAGA